MVTESYIVRCWNCRNEFDAGEAVWCSCDPKHPSKVCPFCLQCFCPADDDYKRAFWEKSPETLKEEVSLLERSRDRLGEILIRNQKLSTPQLLEALVTQKKTGGLLGKILVQKGWVSQADVDEALKHQGYKPLVDTQGQEVTPTPVAPTTPPQEFLNYLLNLAAKKGASDIHIEPLQEELAVKFRIDGFFYKTRPLPRSSLDPMLERIESLFKLEPDQRQRPQKGRASLELLSRDYDLLAQTLPTQMGTAVTIKLVDRRYFLKNFTALGLTPPDQLFLVRALDEPSGLILVTSPPYNGAMTTCYSLMDHLAKSERRVVSLEPSIQWEVPYVQQIEVNKDKGLDYPSALRSVAGIKPDVVFLLDLGDKETASMACQLSSSLLVITTFPAFSAAESVWRFYEYGVPLSLFGRNLSLVLNQRLVRRICTNCREGGTPADPQKLAAHGITEEEARTLKLYRGAGCPACNKIGYRRRKGIFEVMTVDRELRDMLSRSSSLEEIERASIGAGMETLRERCLRDVREGITAIEEFIRWRL
jgi:type IV pilus assembly protein PilB